MDTVLIIFEVKYWRNFFQITDSVSYCSIFICIETAFRQSYFGGDTAFNANYNKAHPFLRCTIICRTKNTLVQNIIILRRLQYFLKIVINSKGANHRRNSIFNSIGIHNYVVFVYLLCLAEHALNHNRWFNLTLECRCIQHSRIVI